MSSNSAYAHNQGNRHGAPVHNTAKGCGARVGYLNADFPAVEVGHDGVIAAVCDELGVRLDRVVQTPPLLDHDHGWVFRITERQAWDVAAILALP